MAVLTKYDSYSNPSELLGSHVFKDYINELKKSLISLLLTDIYWNDI